jgi:hypothetical protein
MWSRSGCPHRLNSGNDERHAQRLRATAPRRVMQRDEDLPILVSSVVCVCARLLCIAWLENGFVDVVTWVHGHSMFAECFPVRPHSLLLHGPVFHSRCCYVAGIWYWAPALWAIRMEMDWQHNNYRSDRPQFHSGTRSRPVSAKWTTMNYEV